MQQGMPSLTALGAASHRAAHQKIEKGLIFRDPLAVRILGSHAGEAIREAERNPSRRRMRLFIAIRTRFAEDLLDKAVAAGVRQLVVLGAGLDTYAYRNPHGNLRVFEVDHPATQAWKRERLAEAAIDVPASLTFAPVDFEAQTLGAGLADAGFDPALPTFFTWLGVVPYLTEPAVFATLDFMARLPGGAHVVFDYGNPPSPGDTADYAAARDELARRVAAIGEELKTQFETRELHARLGVLGFRDIEDLGPRQMRERYFPANAGPVPERGGHVVRAATPGCPKTQS
jgi:methyltransferase (TIGR00027 family)